MMLARSLLSLYPRTWRERYGEEFSAMLEQCPLSLTDTLTIVHGAFDAHLHPQFGTTGLPYPEKARLMLRALRSSLISVFCAYIGFIVAGCVFAKMMEEGIGQVTQASMPLFTLYVLVFAGSIIALGAMLIGGLPVILAIIRRAIATRRIGPLLLLSVPPFAFAALLLFIHLQKAPVPRIIAQISFAAFFLTMAAISATAVSTAIARSEIQPALLRFATPLAAIVTGAMLLMLIGTFGWGLSLRASDPEIFLSYHGFMDASTAVTWLLITIGMAFTTVIASVSTLRGMRSSALLKAKG